MAAEFSSPWLLLLLPLAALLLVGARLPWWRAARRAGPAATRQEARRLGIRLIWLALPVLALAGLTLSRPLDRQAVVFVLDGSASTAAVRDQLEAAARDALAQLRGGDLAGVVAVASGARVEESPSLRPIFGRLAASLPAEATDLATGLRLAGAMVPEGFTGRVVLLSDGRQTRGDAVSAARELASRGLTVDALPLGADPGPDLRMEAVELPDTAYRGEVSTLVARLFAGRPGGATLRVYRDSRLLLSRQVALRGGREEVALPVPVGDPGLHRYRVELAADDPAEDSTSANNSLGAVQRVKGPPRVLVAAKNSGDAGLLAGALPAAGAEVEVVSPAALPADLAGLARFDAVVLADLPAEALAPGTMEALESYVRDLGRGLVMAGGPESFGPGGYAGTPVERALPVYMDLRGRGRQPRVAMALVIDKSGSMMGAKVEMAKEAAVRSLRLLRPEDRAAVLAFDSVPQWVSPLSPLSELGRMEDAVGRIYAAGGTEIYPALASAFVALRDVEADVKHVILLTDGRSGSSGDYVQLLEQMREARISLSTVGVGEDADGTLLEAMARAGRGRYHFTTDPASIPQLFTQETIMATRTLLVDGRFYPSAASSSPLLLGIAALPPLDGYVATTGKETAEMVLVSAEGDPVLAAWQYGLGRAVAWTPDLAGRWSRAWSSSPEAAALWGNVISWLLPPEGEGELTVKMEAAGEGSLAVVVENRSGWEEVRPTRALLLGPEGERTVVDLAPAGPGRYRAVAPVAGFGAHVATVTQALPAGGELRGEAGWVAAYPAEYREFGVDRAAMGQIAAAGGGVVLEEPAQAVGPARRPSVARWPAGPLLLVLAALFWPLEIASRRFLMPVLRLRAVAVVTSAGGPGGSGPAVPAPSQPAPAPEVATARRLLDRKRALREGRKQG